MIRGAIKWDDPTTHAIQDNNAIEAILRASGRASWLETCGPTSAENGCRALGYHVDFPLPGGAVLQFSDLLTLWMNDPTNYDTIRAESGVAVDPNHTEENEIWAYYPSALKHVLGAKADFVERQTFDSVAQTVANGNAAMIGLIKPGHFLCAVAYDDAQKALIYRDPWPERTGTKGYNLRMESTEFDGNARPLAIVIHPPGVR